MSHQLQLLYDTPRGAGVVRGLPMNNAVIARSMKTLRKEARLMLDGRKIGAVVRCSDPEHHHQFCWWFEEVNEER